MKTMKQLVTTVSALAGQGYDAGMLISTPTLDRDQDRVLPEGLDLTNFKHNSPLLWAHDYRSIPIGSVTSVDIGRSGIKAWWRWLQDDPFADRVRNAWDQGIIRAASIGFSPRHSVPNEEGGRDITRWELLEISLVPIPANPEAVRTLKALGLETPSSLVQGQESWTPESLAEAAVREIDRRWSGSRPVLTIQDAGGPELYRIDLDTVERLSRGVIAEGVAGLVGKAIHAELNYMRGRIE